ncbi:dihydroneopterin aldolase [Marinobacter zhanjiangensis]|uniref:7,8-dihydroneopterin aldolase n=1 Tax=Marinobacter zhanjiangensis TaxID=578215 RepID=A0ABQ3B7M2_9GAMM|nr:dihydroneopterin aldolase [Marinobacter zhanjiangensis]GGY83483.1 7,8-dihydroneopterin aldolase [Marinobacter zhanjiangensis]
MTDSVLIEGLVVEAVIGVYDWEREIRQQLRVDLEMAWDNRPAAASDEVRQALDYAAVSEHVQSFFEGCQPALLETAAEKLAADLMEAFAVPALRLTLWKPGAVPAAHQVGVRIQRGDWR